MDNESCYDLGVLNFDCEMDTYNSVAINKY